MTVFLNNDEKYKYSALNYTDETEIKCLQRLLSNEKNETF